MSKDVSMTENTQCRLGWVLLYVDDVERAVAFAEAAYGLATRFITPDADYAEMETGTTALAYCARTLGSNTTGLDLSAGSPPSTNVTLVVSDVDAAYARAIAAGAVSVLKPTVKPWGQTSSFVRDPDGHLIELASPVRSN